MNQEVKNFIKAWWHIFVVILFGCFAAGFILFYSISTENWLDWNSTINHKVNPQTARWLDGMILDRDQTNLKPFAVMLENHIDSRPIAGLEDASLIYEIIVEGDITRFLAIFDQTVDAKKIGPVRSARPFFVELAEEWNPVYFHAGGSAQALTMLKQSPMYNINEISADGIYFWRDKSRTAPHNLFTSADQVRRAMLGKEIDLEADFKPWQFKNDSLEADLSNLVTDIEVSFSSNPYYQVLYQYNEENNDYTRYLAGKVHKTESGIILKAKNIIVQHVNYKIIDDYGRLIVDLDSGGLAEIYLDAQMIKGAWKKSDGRTYFYDSLGDEVSFNRGTTWIELVFN